MSRCRNIISTPANTSFSCTAQFCCAKFCLAEWNARKAATTVMQPAATMTVGSVSVPTVPLAAFRRHFHRNSNICKFISQVRRFRLQLLFNFNGCYSYHSPLAYLSFRLLAGIPTSFFSHFRTDPCVHSMTTI
jgi:hypothetical protein